MVDHGSTLLEVQDLVLRFGGVTAIDGVDLAVPAGQICGLIGPNGAGKTSLFNCISRFYRPDVGPHPVRRATDVLRSSRRIDSPTSASPAPSRNWPCSRSMSVRENVELATHARTTARAGWRGLCAARGASRAPQPRGRAEDLLDLLDLIEVADAPGHDAPLRHAQAGRDRPRAAPATRAAAARRAGERSGPGGARRRSSTLLRRLRAELDLTILLIEHQMAMVLATCATRRRARPRPGARERHPEEIAADPAVVQAYLGAPA